MLARHWIWVVIVGCSVVLAAFAEPQPRRKLRKYRLLEFYSVNPPSDDLEETYIWMPCYSYHADEKIPLYCETFVSPRRMRKEGIEKTLVLLDDLPIRWCDSCFNYHAGYRGTLLVRRAPFDRLIRVILRRYKDVPKYPPEVLFPDPEKIPHHWLHGTPVGYERLYGSKETGWAASAVLVGGESMVRYVPNLLDIWYLKKGPDGRIYVKCMTPIPGRRRMLVPFKVIWLPLEGRYRIQHRHSNIIEFEIRQ